MGGWLINEADIRYVLPGYGSEVQPGIRLVLENTLVPIFTTALSALISAFYPAWRVAWVRVVEALRYM